jgi:hypothetical protein
MLYLTCSPPQTRTDECRSFYDIWLCAEKASFSDALPGSYLQWLQSRNPEGAKLKVCSEKLKSMKIQAAELRNGAMLTTFSMSISDFW